MFTICNELSYNGRMIYATDKKDHNGIIQILGKSRWINIIDNSPREKLSIAEYAKLKEMLVILIEKKGIEFLKNVYFITLFKDFLEYIMNNLLNDINGSIKQTDRDCYFLKNWKRSNVGTVHSFQGKENDIVFFLLGVQGSYKNCANPLLKKTNVLNVAMSKAKIATYIIGKEEGLKKNFKIVLR
jgi:superfamily I DNA and/or RNA helicase